MFFLIMNELFSVSISFSVSIENHPCYPKKQKMYKLFVYGSIIFPVIEPNEHINTIHIIIVT